MTEKEMEAIAAIAGVYGVVVTIVSVLLDDFALGWLVTTTATFFLSMLIALFYSVRR